MISFDRLGIHFGFVLEPECRHKYLNEFMWISNVENKSNGVEMGLELLNLDPRWEG